MRRTLFALSLTASVLAAPSGVLDRLWSLFSAIWEDPPPVQQPQTKAGCGADPNGLCGTSTTPQTDAGCTADPSGLCQPGS
jgi:hypothetical protein